MEQAAEKVLTMSMLQSIREPRRMTHIHNSKGQQSTPWKPQTAEQNSYQSKQQCSGQGKWRGIIKDDVILKIDVLALGVVH